MINGIKINHIVAVNNLGYIGKDNKLLCEDPADLKHFKEVTKNGIIVMGKNTWESLPKKPLPNRQSFVLSKSSEQSEIFYNDLFELLDDATKIAKLKNLNEIWIIGGESLYSQTSFLIDDIYISVIDDNSDGDTKYCNNLLNNKKCTNVKKISTKTKFFIYT